MIRLILISSILLTAGCFSEHPFGRGQSDGSATGELPLTNLSFNSDIKPLLSTCTACHAAGAGGWVYDGGVNAYAQAVSVVSPGLPGQSDLLINTRGAANHGGGTIYNASSDAYNAIEAWIVEGALDN
ncbi:MAG: hypothetical protein HKN43_10985 [Rhodothermales bacterium]|nr:hypothetical protein [Rhodothermales bacterium]